MPLLLDMLLKASILVLALLGCLYAVIALLLNAPLSQQQLSKTIAVNAVSTACI